LTASTLARGSLRRGSGTTNHTPHLPYPSTEHLLPLTNHLTSGNANHFTASGGL
jgi:hypothetical protein